MKKLLLIQFILITLIAGGCRHILSDPSSDPVYPDNLIEDSNPESEIPEHSTHSDSVLHFPAGSIALLSYEDDMDFNAVLGDPQAIKTIRLENADTFSGSYQKTMCFQDTTLILFSPPQDGRRFYLINLESQSEYLTTNRGISIGSSLEDLQNAYPEVIRSLDGTTGKDGRYEMKVEDHTYTYLYFFVKEEKIIKIQLLHEFA